MRKVFERITHPIEHIEFWIVNPLGAFYHMRLSMNEVKDSTQLEGPWLESSLANVIAFFWLSCHYSINIMHSEVIILLMRG